MKETESALLNPGQLLPKHGHLYWSRHFFLTRQPWPTSTPVDAAKPVNAFVSFRMECSDHTNSPGFHPAAYPWRCMVILKDLLTKNSPSALLHASQTKLRTTGDHTFCSSTMSLSYDLRALLSVITINKVRTFFKPLHYYLLLFLVPALLPFVMHPYYLFGSLSNICHEKCMINKLSFPSYWQDTYRDNAFIHEYFCE